ncbi:MAG: hypothetical protein RJA57_1402 [Bacteroidota bacterium]|jgi:D-alanyl-D-alanine carboxypeptidase/D-alanyl-D-alanine-endopeptidase (penicillin-binding protein 4)
MAVLRFFSVILPLSWLLVSCGVSHRMARIARTELLTDSALRSAHTGVSIYEPKTKRTWYDHQGDRYFVPASNTKIPTCYAALRYLGDSLPLFRLRETPDSMWIMPCGHPGFLNPEFPQQELFHRLRSVSKTIVLVLNPRNVFSEYGSGWSWDDYQEAYMAERAALPVYGNVVRFRRTEKGLVAEPPVIRSPYFREPLIQLLAAGDSFTVVRKRDENLFRFERARQPFREQVIPFTTEKGMASVRFLRDTLGKPESSFAVVVQDSLPGSHLVRSGSTDSFLRQLMHRSDNFFAEQSLLMVSQQRFGYMNDRQLLDTLLNDDLADLPQRPRWADGSGLSRYNLFTPQDFIQILEKMRSGFGMERMQAIFPTGGKGTLSGYYRADSGQIYAKTGTLSGVVTLSGYLYTRRGKLLLFSVLVNHHQAAATRVRKAVERFLQSVRNRY